ncbi:MAG: hypothetical protein AMXMBFR58_00040 [Phycisphaerae bacterium]
MSQNPQPANSSSMTSQDAARIQSSQAKQEGGQVTKDSFAARAQSAAAKNTAQKK